MHLAAFADEVLAQCEVCRAFDTAPNVPVAGTSTVAMFNEKLELDLWFLGDIPRKLGMPRAARGLGFWPPDEHPVG